MNGAGAPVVCRPEVSSLRLVSTLGGAGILAGLALVFAFQATRPAILRNQAAALERAVAEVLAAADRTESWYVSGNTLVHAAPEGVDPATLDRVFLGYREDRPVGFALVASGAGFQDQIELIFGYDPAEHRLLGLKVLSSRETPGLGDRIEKDTAWLAQFVGAVAPLVVVKKGRGSGDPHEIDAISGATISSKAVLGIVGRRLEEIGVLLEGAWGRARP